MKIFQLFYKYQKQVYDMTQVILPVVDYRRALM